MKLHFSVLVVAALSFFNPSAQASTEKDFLEAEKIAWAGDYRGFKSATAALDHPLLPYVEMAYWKRHPRMKHQAEIESFLNIYQSTPLEWPVRKAWLNYLAKHDKKAEYIRNYRDTDNVELRCHYLSFQLALGAPEKAILGQVSELWIEGHSQPKQCDGLFSKWRKAGNMTNERVWQRLTAAAQDGQHSLIPYLKTLLPAKQQYLADLYYQVRRDPSAAAGLYRYKHKSGRESEIAVYGIKRLIWREPELALKAWDKLEKMFTFTEAQKEDVYYRFALALASKQHPEAVFWLNKVPVHLQDAKLMQWQLANLLQRKDWAGIVAFFTGKEGLNLGQKYWLAYGLEQLGKKLEAIVIWRELAKERDYYGFLSAARLGLPVSLNEKTLKVPPSLLAKVENAPGFRRAKALYELKRYTDARREWNYLVDTSSDAEKLAAAQLAAGLDWYDSAIVTLAQIEAWDYIDLRFPDAFQDLFKRFSERSKIDMSWSMAIARRESSFAPDARSHADAHGLMQLRPSTAKYVNKGNIAVRRLYQPTTNINLGTRYLQYLKRKNHDNEVLATASYNAGYHKISKWIPDQPLPAELWIELIPYRETRDYVKNVFAYRQVYHAKLGNQDNLLAPLLEMQIGG